MPHNKSAKKRLKQNVKRRLRNRATLSDLKTQIKKFFKAVKANNADAARAELLLAYKKLDKCGVRGYIHKNAAARHKSRLTARLNAISGTAPADNTAPTPAAT